MHSVHLLLNTMKGRKPLKQYGGRVEIGSVIKDRLQASKHSVVWFAEQLECSRTNVYKIFGKKSIGTEELFRISEVLGYDFFKIYSNKLDYKK